MDQVKVALTKKIGPFPGWAWAGIAAVGVWLLAPHLKGLAGNSSSSATTGTVTDTTGYSAGPVGPPGPQGIPGLSGAPGAAAGAPPPPPPAPAPPPAPGGTRTHVVVSGDTLWGIAQTYLGAGYRYPEIFALSHFRSGDPNLIYPGEVAVIPAAGGAGRGGAAIGNRRDWLMSPHHPDLARPVRYHQFIRAVGGAAAHTANVHAVAAKTGVHPARLLALNSHHRGLIRIA